MKKSLIIIIILCLSGCVNYHLNIEEFRRVSLNEGYYLDNENREYQSYDYVKDVCYAYNREKDYLVEFINLENNDYAYRFFLTNKEAFSEEITRYVYLKEQNNMDYNLYHIETDKYYMLIIRMDDNVIYVNTDIEYKNDIEDLLLNLKINY